MAEQETLLERLARERNITVEEMRRQIAIHIEQGWNDADSQKRAQWRKIPCTGKLYEEDCEDLLRRYLID